MSPLQAQEALVRIARVLADGDAPIIDGTYANGHDWCVLCDGEGEAEEGHDAGCPWRLARQLNREDKDDAGTTAGS